MGRTEALTECLRLLLTLLAPAPAVFCGVRPELGRVPVCHGFLALPGPGLLGGGIVELRGERRGPVLEAEVWGRGDT